ncbi:hypothetical protein V1505DRAFT_375587 [Lipomyces doorenjongii]
MSIWVTSFDGVNPYAYPENRPLSEEAKQAMFVRDSSATLTQVAGMVNVTYGTSWPDKYTTVPTIIMRNANFLRQIP